MTGVIMQWPPWGHASLGLPKFLRWNCLQAGQTMTSASNLVAVSVPHTVQARTKPATSEELLGAVWDVMERANAWVWG